MQCDIAYWINNNNKILVKADVILKKITELSNDTSDFIYWMRKSMLVNIHYSKCQSETTATRVRQILHSEIHGGIFRIWF